MTKHHAIRAAAAESYCGAAASFAGMALISIARARDRYVIVPGKSAHFVLPDAGQEALRRLYSDVAGFVSEAGITEVVFRVGAVAGPKSSGHTVARMQAALELVPGLAVNRVHYLSLRPFADLHRNELPEPYPTVPRPVADVHRHAISAARLSRAILEGDLKLADGRVRLCDAALFAGISGRYSE
jgi:hypothetical protein